MEAPDNEFKIRKPHDKFIKQLNGCVSLVKIDSVASGLYLSRVFKPGQTPITVMPARKDVWHMFSSEEMVEHKELENYTVFRFNRLWRKQTNLLKNMQNL